LERPTESKGKGKLMARLVESQIEDLKKGSRPPKHWGSRDYTYKKDLLKRRKVARQRKKASRQR